MLFPKLVLCIAVMCIRKTPHLQIFPLWKLFSSLYTNETCYRYLQILCGRVISGDICLPIICSALLKFCVTKDFWNRSVFYPSPKSFHADTRGWAGPASAVTSRQLFPVHPISLPDRSHARLSGKTEFLAIFYIRQWWQLRYTKRVSFHPVYITQNDVYCWPVLTPPLCSSSLTWVPSLVLLPVLSSLCWLLMRLHWFWVCWTALDFLQRQK